MPKRDVEFSMVLDKQTLRDLNRALDKLGPAIARSGLVMGIVGPDAHYKVVETDPETGKTRNIVPANYAHLVEGKVGPHIIPTTLIDGKVVARSFMHPGTPPRPFLRPALDEQRGRVTEIFRKDIFKSVEREAKKLAKKGKR